MEDGLHRLPAVREQETRQDEQEGSYGQYHRSLPEILRRRNQKAPPQLISDSASAPTSQFPTTHIGVRTVLLQLPMLPSTAKGPFARILRYPPGTFSLIRPA